MNKETKETKETKECKYNIGDVIIINNREDVIMRLLSVKNSTTITTITMINTVILQPDDRIVYSIEFFDDQGHKRTIAESTIDKFFNRVRVFKIKL